MFESDGQIREYVGGYSDWLRQGRELAETDNPHGDDKTVGGSRKRRREKAQTKLSYKDQRELDSLPDEIETLESTIASMQAAAAQPGFYDQEQAEIQAALADLSAAESRLEERLERWSELESLQLKLRSE